MLWMYPQPPADPTVPQWKVFSLEIRLFGQPRHRRMLQLFIRRPKWSLLWKVNGTVDSMAGVAYSGPSRYTMVYIVHPNGGGAQKLQCVECYGEYAFNANFLRPCSTCQVKREDKLQVWWGPCGYVSIETGQKYFKQSWIRGEGRVAV